MRDRVDNRPRDSVGGRGGEWRQLQAELVSGSLPLAGAANGTEDEDRRAHTTASIVVAQHPSEADQTVLRGRIVMLRVRVEDAELGKLIDAVMGTVGKFLTVDSEPKANALIQELLDGHNAVNQRNGALLTKTY